MPTSPSTFLEWVAGNDLVVDDRPFDWDAHRYLLPLYEDTSQEIVVLKGAQIGATIWLLLRLLWWVTEQTLKAGLYFPTKEALQGPAGKADRGEPPAPRPAHRRRHADPQAVRPELALPPAHRRHGVEGLDPARHPRLRRGAPGREPGHQPGGGAVR